MDEKVDGKANTPTEIVTTITLYPDGRLSIQSPLLIDKMAMFGLLESAKFAIVAHQVDKPNITPAPGGIMNFIKSGKRL